MPLVLEDSNELLMNGTKQPLFTPNSQTGLQHYSTSIFFDEMQSDDEIIIRVFVLDEFAAFEKLYREVIVKGVQKTNRIVNWVPTSSYRVTCEQVSGTFRTITWALYTS